MASNTKPPPGGGAEGRDIGADVGADMGASTSPKVTATETRPAVTHDASRCAPCGALDIYVPNARLRHEMRAWAKGYRRICDLAAASAGEEW